MIIKENKFLEKKINEQMMKTAKWKKNMYKSIGSQESHQDEISALKLAPAVLMEPFATRQEKDLVFAELIANKTF